MSALIPSYRCWLVIMMIKHHEVMLINLNITEKKSTLFHQCHMTVINLFRPHAHFLTLTSNDKHPKVRLFIVINRPVLG